MEALKFTLELCFLILFTLFISHTTIKTEPFYITIEDKRIFAWMCLWIVIWILSKVLK